MGLATMTFQLLLPHIGHNMTISRVDPDKLAPKGIAIVCLTCSKELIRIADPTVVPAREPKPYPKSATKGGKVK